MGIETERKFLVAGEFKSAATRETRLVQGYLSSVPERSVRVRLDGEKGILTIKGMTGESGLSRYEWEHEITAAEAEELLQLCEPGWIEKTRYLVPAGEHTFEVDEFHGENEGLILAEIELSHESQSFPRPEWLGEEVTGDLRYYNVRLMQSPFRSWPREATTDEPASPE